MSIFKNALIEKLFFEDVDLYKLYRVVDRLGGHTRVTNKNLWKQVGKKLGFENTWSINQVIKILYIRAERKLNNLPLIRSMNLKSQFFPYRFVYITIVTLRALKN